MKTLTNSLWSVAPITLTLLLSACAAPAHKDSSYRATQPPISQPRTVVNGTIYHESTNLFLFEDVTARRVGDILTVILEEKTDASKTASTSATKNSSADIPNPTIFGADLMIEGRQVFQNSIQADRSFAGDGESTQSNSLVGDVTVTVVQVLPNGNLVVGGEKLLTLNQGSEVVRISGIVRPVDISTANTIKSTQIANPEITYSGDGIIGDSNRAGLLTRFFHSRWWPF